MRRLTAAAGIAVAMLALTACRSNPSVAAYVGDVKFTEDKVTQLIDQVKAIPNVDPQQVPDRYQVVQLLVIDEVCQRLAKEQKVALPPVQAPAGTPEYGVIQQRLQTCRETLPVKAVQPTPAELREVYDNGVAVGAIDPTDPANSFENLGPRLAQSGELGGALAQRKMLTEAAEGENVSINPRYRTLTYSLLNFNQGPALSFDLGQQADAVQEAQAPADTAAQPQPQQ